MPPQLIDAIAERVADIVLDRLAGGARASGSGPWMRSQEAAEYLGWSRSALYDRVSRRALPHYKVDGILLFRRDELDAWLEQFREEPRERLSVPPAPVSRSEPRARAASSRSPRAEPSGDRAAKQKTKRRARPLPPPISGDEEHKKQWARQLEITRAELDEMSPSAFRKAWDERNKRLEEGGVFERVDELTDAHGWDAIDKMTPSELITAVAELGTTSQAQTEHAHSEPSS